MIAVEVDVPSGFDAARTLALHRFGPWDPTVRASAGVLEKACHVGGEPAVFRFVGGGTRVRVEIAGPGAADLARHASALVGATDADWLPPRTLPRALRDANVGMRVTRVPWLSDLLTRVILQQRVQFVDAARAWAMLCRRFGGSAPDAPGLSMPPSFATLAKLPEHELLRVGIDLQRRRTLRAAWAVARRVDALVDLDAETACAKLASLPGIGPWTRALMGGLGFGDADAVPLGDYGLPSAVAFALAGEARADDARMLELLAPFAGARFRVARAVWAAGLGPPRRAPRRARAEVW